MRGEGIVVDRANAGVWNLRLDRPPGNVLDIKLCNALAEKIAAAAFDEDAKLLVVSTTGENFSFGASVEEHLPDSAAEMLGAMSSVVHALYSHPYPTLAAVRGRCLGGGLEAALACDMVFAEKGAVLGAPEIRLGVFAPAATVLLQSSVPRSIAAEILLTGRDIDAAEALQWGIVNRVVRAGKLDAEVGKLVETCFAPRSAVSLRQATRAFREGAHSRSPARCAEKLVDAEQRYLDDLLPLHDGTEGIRAFLEKREPKWEKG